MAVTVDTASLLQRLEQARAQLTAPPAGAPPIIASDGDDTIWHGDIGEALFAAAMRDRALRPQALAALRYEAESHDLAIVEDEVHALAQQLLLAWGQGRYPEARTFAMMSWMFAGWPERELAAYCDGVLDAWGFETAVHASMRAMLQWARAYDVQVFLVSASPHLIVERAAVRLGLSASNAVAMQCAVEDGIVQPRLATEPTYAGGKVTCLRARTDAPLLAAFGDSGFDAALLRLARQPVAVSPKASLQARLAELPNAVVLPAS